MNKFLNSLFITFTVILTFACGGGSGSTSTPSATTGGSQVQTINGFVVNAPLPGAFVKNTLKTGAVPAKDGSNQTLSSTMLYPRERHSATLLQDGTVLIAGGETFYDDSFYPFSAVMVGEIFNPTTGAFTQVGSMNTVRVQTDGALLDNGKVAFFGGYMDSTLANPVTTTEVYDPITGNFTITGDLAQPMGEVDFAINVGSGKVLVLGSSLPEVVDTTTTPWSATVVSQDTRLIGAARYGIRPNPILLMPDHRVMIFIRGGNGELDAYNPTTNTIDVLIPNIGSELAAIGTMTLESNGHLKCYLDGTSYMMMDVDPTTGSFTQIGALSTNVVNEQVIPLQTGRVLICGGDQLYSDYIAVTPLQFVYDPSNESSGMISNMNYPRSSFTATLLPDGRVLIVGGESSSNIGGVRQGDDNSASWKSAELFDPNATLILTSNTTQVNYGATFQFAANQSVTWSTTSGVIDSVGLYTAPNKIDPNTDPTQDTVTATNAAGETVISVFKLQ